MAIVLNPHELRVLGVLIEKSLATPQYYPMTINAITAACNQKNNRDPVMNMTEGEVSAALHGLTRWQLVSQAPPDRTSRVNRFLHEVEKRLGWNAVKRAIMAELMLRGPQTLGELRGNASRMTHLEALDYAREVIAELEKCDPPMIVELPRQPGQRATQFAHLLGGPLESQVRSTDMAQREGAPAAADVPDAQSGLTTRVARLESEVEILRAEVRSLSEKLRTASA